MSSVEPQNDGRLTAQVKIQVGQLFQSDTWISYAPELNTIAHGDTKESSLDNLCQQVEEVREFMLQTGRCFQAFDSEDLQPYPVRKTIAVTSPMCVCPRRLL